MRCKNCGTELPDSARFCYMCASPVGEGQPVETDVAPADKDAAKTAAEESAVEDDAASVADGAAAGAADEPAAEKGSDEPIFVSTSGDDDDEDADATGVAPFDPASMPAPVKLEESLPVAAVPFVPMAPAPRSTYVQRRTSRPVRSSRPGTNSAPTSATGYANGAWPQNSAWSLADGDPANAASSDGDAAASADAASANPIGDMKNKFTRALGSWTATSAARSEKKRQEKEIKEAARRVQDRENAAAKAAEERARREAAAKAALEEKERLEREALAASAAVAAAEASAQDAEPQVEEVVDQTADQVEAVDAAEVSAQEAADAVGLAGADAAVDVVDELEPVDVAAADEAEAEPTATEAELAAAFAEQTLAADDPEPVATDEPEHTDAPVAENDDQVTAVMRPIRAVHFASRASSYGTDSDSVNTGDDVSSFWKDGAAEVDGDFNAYDDGTGRSSNGGSLFNGAFKSKKPLIAAGIAVLAVLLIAGGAVAAFSGSSSTKETPQLKPATEVTMPVQETTVAEEPAEEETVVDVKTSVDAYSWSDLSKISALISAATSESDALTIAKKYNLCSSTGALDGTQRKSLQLTDGTTVNMRIAGFWHDLKSDGTGHAGISFIADTSVATMAMSESTSDADWGTCSLREWLNGEFVEMLPSEVKGALVSVSKQTNRYSSTSEQEATDDKVWLVSYTELVGSLESGSYRYGSYNPEGDQYQLFANLGVSWSQSNSAMSVSGDVVNWWTRTADTANADRIIAPRNEDGYAGISRNPTVSGEVGVVPGFCL